MVYDGITEAFLCLSESKRCVSPCVAPTSSAKVFSSSLALVLLFCWKAREHIRSASHAHATPFLPLAMHFAHGNNYAILRVCYALRSKRSNINRLRHFQTVYNKHYVNKTPNLGKIERKTPPALGFWWVCLCVTPHTFCTYFCPPTPLSYNLTITRRKNHAWET